MKNMDNTLWPDMQKKVNETYTKCKENGNEE